MSKQEVVAGTKGWEDRPTLTVEQTAAVLGISRNHAYAAVRAKQIPAVQVGKRWIVATAALKRLLEGGA